MECTRLTNSMLTSCSNVISKDIRILANRGENFLFESGRLCTPYGMHLELWNAVLDALRTRPLLFVHDNPLPAYVAPA